MKLLLFVLFMLASSVFTKDNEAAKVKPCVENPKPDCFCTLQYDPVCGCNGKTYGNACIAECNSITKYKKGECKVKN